MGISKRYTSIHRAGGLLFLAGLAFGCNSHDTSYVDPSALDIDPPGWAGNADRFTSGAGSSGSGGAEGGEPDAGTPLGPIACSVAFVTPSPTGGPLSFGPTDDQDGEPCGSGFTTNVVVSSSAATVTLFVDGSPWAMHDVSDATGSFDGVMLGSRSPATSNLRAVATMADGRTCETTLDSLGVDCAGPSCVLIGPNTTAALTGADDTDAAAPGLQATFQLQTDAENVGQEARLILEGNLDATLTSTVQADTSQAIFSDVTLSEGPARTVQGECRDASGNVTRSSVATWSVTLAACEVAFVTPVPGSDPITLGPSDDEDQLPCGTDFTTSVEVTTNAESLSLLVDGQPVQTVTTNGASARFENVLLGTRTPDASTLSVHATMPDGRTCEVTRASLVVDCEGPTCTLVGPSQNPFLIISDDGDIVAGGLQADFSVQTNVENVAREARLILDDDVDNALTGLVADDAGVGRASFDQITLAEGPVRRVQAECEDALGNISRSTISTWAVDLTACTIEIDSVAANSDPITRLLDAAPGGDIQVPVLGRVVGDACTGVRAGVCTQPLGSFSGTPLTGSDWSMQVTLADMTGSGEVCAEVQDDAGNVTDVRVPVNVRSNDPVVEIASPASGSTITVAGALADLVPLTGTCEATVVVNCTDVDAAVELFVGVTSLGSQTCQGAGSLGQATFTSISLPTLPDGEQHSLTARQTVAGLVGTSPAVLIGADCQAPVVAFTDPLCGGQLNLATDDQEPDSGLQHDVEVSNGGVPFVELNVVRLGGSELLSETGDQTVTSFDSVNFGDPGDVTLTATVTDLAGNVSTEDCQVRVVVAPTVDILVPSEPALLTTADDCAPIGGGYGIAVSGTTSAVPGSSVDVTVGVGVPVAIGPVADGGGGPNTFSDCVAIGDGIDQTLTVTVTEAGSPVGTDSITLTVDTLAPNDPVAAPTVLVVGRREGTVRFTWSHVEDDGGGPLTSYEMHCAAAPIVDEPGWTAARSLTLTTPPVEVPAPDAVEEVGSFRVGTTEFCVIRGRDGTGAPTPLSGVGGNATVNNDFVHTNFTAVVNSASSFTNVVGLGDINGDGANDMMYGTVNQGLQIFFGGTTLTPFDTTADVTINGLAVGALGAVMAPLGDVNGDLIGDFAVSARALNTNAGTVYLFFGKATNSWPITPINVTTGGCGADVCLVGGIAQAFFGWDITGTNFDGNGPNDLVISARANNATDGTVYVILGGSQLSLAAGSIINVPSSNPNGFFINAPGTRSNFGVAVAAVGNGADSRGDLAIGANGVGGDPSALFFVAGEAYVGPGGLIAPSAAPLVEVAVGSSGDHANPVRAIGDFDGDGLGDLALGRNFSAGDGLGTGELYRRNGPIFTSGTGFVFDFSATAGIDNDYATYIATGFHPDAKLGLSGPFGEPGTLGQPGMIGDLDYDGRADLVIGSSGPPIIGATGSVALFYGTPTVSLAGRPRASADFTLASSTGLMVPNFVGDFDGDGFNDLAIVDGGTGTDKLILLH